MMILDKIRENAAAIKSMGRDAIEESKRAGIPAYYVDDAMGGLIREMPDGRRERIRVENGEGIVVEPASPRT